MATDPVCGMYVDERGDPLTLVRDNRVYYFCASTCRETFRAPGAALKSLRYRLAVAWPLSLAVALLTYGLHPPGWGYLAFALASIVQVYAGLPFYRGAVDALRARIGNMDFLIAVGTSAAYAYSTAALFFPGSLPPSLFFDASTLILTLILTGNYLEHFTRERASGALRRLAERLPTTGRVVVGGGTVARPVAEIGFGAVVRVLPGERFPVDGTVRSGSTTVDEAAMTGEPTPVLKRPGDRVLAGTISAEGSVDVVATGVGRDTFLAQVGSLLGEAETARAPLQRLADRIASVFVPVVLLIALGSSLAWYFGAGHDLTLAVLVFVTVAITACPCAFGIATPAAMLVGTGRAAEEGALFKGGDALQRAARVSVLVSDKTGTLTAGAPELTDLVVAPGWAEAEVLRLTASLESSSSHPLAQAVVRFAGHRGLPLERPTDFHSEPGVGVQGRVGARTVSISSPHGRASVAVDVGDLRAAVGALEAAGKSWSVVLVDGRPAAAVGFSDPVLDGASSAVSSLLRMGVKVVMATGDGTRAAERVARLVGIEEVHANLSPSDKVALVRSLQARGERVAFVGDGVNDAPALAAADLGLAVGNGTDVAREAGQVVLIRGGLGTAAVALDLGRRTIAKVRQNLFWAIGYNAVLLPIAAGALVPVVGTSVYSVLPILGALAMGISSTTVVLNSLSLRWVGRRGRARAGPATTADWITPGSPSG